VKKSQSKSIAFIPSYFLEVSVSSLLSIVKALAYVGLEILSHRGKIIIGICNVQRLYPKIYFWLIVETDKGFCY
jgi:hypothetical protein